MTGMMTTTTAAAVATRECLQKLEIASFLSQSKKGELRRRREKKTEHPSRRQPATGKVDLFRLFALQWITSFPKKSCSEFLLSAEHFRFLFLGIKFRWADIFSSGCRLRMFIRWLRTKSLRLPFVILAKKNSSPIQFQRKISKFYSEMIWFWMNLINCSCEEGLEGC